MDPSRARFSGTTDASERTAMRLPRRASKGGDAMKGARSTQSSGEAGAPQALLMRRPSRRHIEVLV